MVPHCQIELSKQHQDPARIFLKTAGTMGEIRGQQLFLKGQFKPPVLNRLIENYTKTYVLCSICNKPDTQIQRENNLHYNSYAVCLTKAELCIIILSLYLAGLKDL